MYLPCDASPWSYDALIGIEEQRRACRGREARARRRALKHLALVVEHEQVLGCDALLLYS